MKQLRAPELVRQHFGDLRESSTGMSGTVVRKFACMAYKARILPDG
jgi:hypothetical protein